jgi:uncharacterized damage-inducible protein DinB
MQRETIRELFDDSDWARDKLMALATELSDEQLDRPSEIGPGSLRATLRHLYGAERIWLERWQGAEQPQFPRSRDVGSMDALWQAWHVLATARNAYLAGLTGDDLRRDVTYTNPAGEAHTFALGDLMLHVCNHGFHHRAQALNMLRHVGVKTPGLDYLFLRVERPTIEYTPREKERLRAMGFAVQDAASPPARLDVDTIRRYFRYGDWACRRVFGSAAKLSDEQLDREFEIGLGRLRKTLLHIRDAEQWWYDNWGSAPPPQFKELPATTPIDELAALMHEIAEKRDAYVGRLTDDDLQRIVTAEVRRGVTLRFRLGESLLQLCGHGTHHRAQALNMLRRLGADVPKLDYVDWLPETHGA